MDKGKGKKEEENTADRQEVEILATSEECTMHGYNLRLANLVGLSGSSCRLPLSSAGDVVGCNVNIIMCKL